MIFKHSINPATIMPFQRHQGTSRRRTFAIKPFCLAGGLTLIISALPSQAIEKNTTLPVSIYCLTYADGLKSVVMKGANDSYHGVALSTANIVEVPQALVEKGQISIYGPAAANGGHPLVTTVDVGAIRRPLIVLCPAKQDGEPPYESKAVETELVKFPLGSFKFLNLSPTSVRISHDEHVIELESGDERDFMPDVPAGEVFAVKMDHKSGGNWALLSSARWASRNDRRTLVCFQLDPVSKRMIVKSVPLRGDPSR
jgi:hypothetical protein